jgi:tetratricopeptide (TPR) repeat protein
LHQISGCDISARKADVVFIHGLGGDPFTTWRYGKDESTSWPHWMGKEFPEAGIWSLGYAASPSRWMRLLPLIGRGSRDSGHSVALPDRASQVLDRMVLKGFGERPILFICHSLGGLLAKQILRNASDHLDARKQQVVHQTRAVLFLATPHTGAALASFANDFRTIFGATVSMEDLRAHDAHLRNLYDWYRNQSPRFGIRSATYFELRKLKGVLPIVTPSSSHPGVGEDPIGLDEDHLSIAKPCEEDSQVYDAACDILRNQVLVASPVVLAATMTPTAAPREVVGKIVPDGFASGAYPRVPREMPPTAYKFFGREAERKQVADRLRDGLNTAVTGLAGFGKTALAAHALVDVVGRGAANLPGSRFPDGLVYLDLYTFRGQAEPAWSALANRLRGPEYMELRPARDRATEACRAQRILIVIEGGEEADGSFGRTSVPELFSVLSPENRWLLLTRVSNQAAAMETVRIHESLNSNDAGALLDWLTQGRPLAANVRESILELLEGHPLALNWAGNLLALDEEDPAGLAQDWKAGGLPGLNDPRQAEHTLQWLFARSVRGLNDLARQALSAAGLLSRAPFSFDAIATALGRSNGGHDDDDMRRALKDLIQRGLLRRAENDCWQFSHVLGYRFARDEDRSDPSLRERLGHWLRARIVAALKPGAGAEAVASLGRQLDHAAAILRADPDQRLWDPLAQALLYDVADHLESIGRLDLVTSALEAVAVWLSRFPDDLAQEPYWRGQRCVLIVDRGDVLRDQGDLGGALSAYRESLAVRKCLADADPSNAGWQRDLSVSQDKIGDVLENQGDLAGALAAYCASQAVRKRLAEADPSNAVWQRDLSVSLDSIGDVLREQGDLAGASTAYRESLVLSRHLAAADPSNMMWQRDLSVSQDRAGDVLRDQGDLAGALATYRESLALRKRLAEFDPSNAKWQRDLSVSRDRIGDVLQDQGNLAGALMAYRESLAVRSGLAEADPSNAGWQRDLSLSHERIGDVLRRQGDLAGALEAYRESLPVRKRLAEADPSNAQWQRDLSISQERIGDVLQDQGNLAGALATYRESLVSVKRLVEVSPSNALWQWDLSASQERIGDMLLGQGDRSGALASYRESLALRSRLVEADPSNARWQRDLGVSRNKVGDVLWDQGDMVGALAAYSESLAARKRLVEDDPSNADWLRSLSFGLTRMAEFHEQQGARTKALPLAEESLSIDERLAALDRSNVTWQQDLAVSSALVARLRSAK